jgi:hypothetical protein
MVRGLSQGLQFCLLPERSFINGTGRSQGHVQMASKSVCTSTVVVSPDPLSPTPSNSLAVKSPENTEGYLDDTEPATAGDNQMEFSSDWYSPSIGEVTKNYELRWVMGQYLHCLIVCSIQYFGTSLVLCKSD